MTDWKVRCVDYPAQFRQMEGAIMGTIREVLAGGDLIQRDQLRSFEAHLASFVGTKYAVGVSNCTDGMRLALQAAGIGAGDEVITVSHTFVATAAAIHHAGATPVLVDIGEDHNMDVDRVEEAITPRTRAILPVHLNGRLCAMDRLMAVAEGHGLQVIEDAAQALGGTLNGKGAGSFGTAGCFSFYPAKILGAYGDAGAVVTDSEELAETVRLLRNHGRVAHGDVALWSFNCRLDNLQAAILDLKLPHVPRWVERRRQLASLYHQLLQDLPQLRLPPPPVDEGPFFDVFQNYELEAEDRDGLVARLEERGVEAMLPWGGRGVHQLTGPGLAGFQLPRTERLFRDVLMLPLHPELTDPQVHYVADVVRDYYRAR